MLRDGSASSGTPDLVNEFLSMKDAPGRVNMATLQRSCENGHCLKRGRGVATKP
jgi:hypothetical protein